MDTIASREHGGPTESADVGIDVTQFTLQERVLAYAMAQDLPTHVISYTPEGEDDRIIHQAELQDFRSLVTKLRTNPKSCLAVGRANVYAIHADPHPMDAGKRVDRVRRYTEAFLSLQVKLDRLAFPPNPKQVYEWVPIYVPDGLSDMGSDPEPDEAYRSSKREKIRIDKIALFRQAQEFLMQMYQRNLGTNTSSTEAKMSMVEAVAKYIHKTMPYDYLFRAGGGKTVLLDDIAKKKETVCRHHALYAQILMQALGLESRLLKCTMDGEPHAANLVRINSVWYLLDTTNPKTRGGEMYLRQIPQNSIDLNGQIYKWNFTRPAMAGGKRHELFERYYESRHDMFYRIMDNRQRHQEQVLQPKPLIASPQVLFPEREPEQGGFQGLARAVRGGVMRVIGALKG